jgi:hypothetical protein
MTNSTVEYRHNQPLLSAPGAMSYYPTPGFELASNAYVIRRKR